MRRFFAVIFLFLYLYNIIGYLAVFSVVEHRIRSEVKKFLATRIPDSQLAHFALHTGRLHRNEYPINWLDESEFEYNGQMYDVVLVSVSAETTYFVCINDEQEDHLKDQLGKHVQRQMQDTGQSSKFDSFKEVFKDSFAGRIVLPKPALSWTTMTVTSNAFYHSVPSDIPVPPPRPV